MAETRKPTGTNYLTTTLRYLVVGQRALWQLFESHPVRTVLRWYWATWDMARDGTRVLVDVGWYGPESRGFPDGVAD